MVEFDVGNLVLLNTVNLKLKKGKGKFNRKIIGPFKVEERISSQSYKLALPNEWRIHNVSQVSLLKRFCTDKFQQVSQIDETSMTLEEINEPIYIVENILQWSHKKVKNKYIREFLVLWVL